MDFVVFTDTAFGIFRAEGFSSTAYMYCIGRANAPFSVSAKAQDDIATCPMTAEYYSAVAACKDILFCRQLLSDLGWPLSSPTTVYVDNKTMISLVVAPQVSVRSRHIEVTYHLIRQHHSC